MEGFVTLFHLFLFFVVTSSILDTPKLWLRFFQTSLFVSLVAGFYGVLQLMHKIPINQGGVRLDATFGNATYFSVYMMFHVFFALFLLLRERMNKWVQWIYGLIIVFQLYIIYHTATRGVFLGLIAGALVITALLGLLEKERKMLRRVSLITLGAVVFIVAVFFGVKNTSFVKDDPVLGRFSSINANEARPRLYVWNMAWQGVKERPILGWGQESFNYVFNKYYDPRMYTQEQWFDRTHNVFLDWLIAGGILGLLAYLSLFVFLLYYIWQGIPSERIPGRLFKRLAASLRLSSEESLEFSLVDRAVLTGLIVAYFIQNIFVFDNITSYILFMTVLAYVHSIKGKEMSLKWVNRLNVDSSMQNKVGIPVIIALTLFAVYAFNVKGYLAGRTLLEALRPQPGGVTENYKYYEKALAYHSYGDAEIREQLVQAALNALNSSADVSVKQNYFNLAQSEMVKQINKTPDDARYQLFLGTFLSRYRLFDDAAVYLEKAIALSPRKQTIYFEVGSNYINKGDTAKAVEYFKKAYELEPKFTIARDFYVVSLIYNHEQAAADKILMDAYGTVLVSSDPLVKAYLDTKQYSRVVGVWKQRVADNPNNHNAHVSLASAYLQAGERTNAIKELQEAIRINPDFKAQGEFYISEIKAGRNP